MRILLAIFAIWNIISALRFLLADIYYGRGCSRALAGDQMILPMQKATPETREKIAVTFRQTVKAAMNDLQAANELNPGEAAYQTSAEGSVTDMSTLLTGMARVFESPHKEALRGKAREVLHSWDEKSTYPERIYGQLAQLSADEGNLEECARWLEKVLLADESIVATHSNLVSIYRKLGKLDDANWHEWEVKKWSA